MKLINLKYGLVVLVTLISITSCSEDYLEVTPTGTNLESNYYKNEDEAYSGLIAVYDMMRKWSNSFDNMVCFLNAGSDDFYAGGGGASDGAGIQSFSNYTIYSGTVPGSMWNDYYQGIFKANTLLTKLPDVPMDSNTKARFTAETKALRAYYYFQLVTLFRNIPLITKPVNASEIYQILQANPNDVYKQIETDLTEAIQALPVKINTATEAGRLNKGAAQAILGKVFLYQHKDAQAATVFAQVNGDPTSKSNQYGYSLLNNYADLWKVDNKFNTESILEVSHTNIGNTTWDNWGWGSDEANTINTMTGPRGYSATSPSAPKIVAGWSFNPATADLVNVLKNDPRYNATILDMNDLIAKGSAIYNPGYMDTGYFLRKYMPTQADITNAGGETALNYRQNAYVIRLADTFLLEAEALGGTGTRAQALLDAVRSRVGLPSVPVSLEAIALERRKELAGEGHRWNDLIRTGKASLVLAARGFIAGKNEILPIPLRETENTKIVQNPNYK